MPSGIKISELDQAESLTFNDLVEISRPEIINEVVSYQSHSATIEQLSGLIEGSNQIGYRYSVNGRKQLVGSSNTAICQIRDFSILKDSDANNWSEFTINTTFAPGSNKIIAYVSYTLNGVSIPRNPIETWTVDGYHTMNLGYLIRNLKAGQGYTWIVYLRLEGGTGEIEIGEASSVITVIGFTEEQRWSGEINKEEKVPLYSSPILLKDAVASYDLKITKHVHDIRETLNKVATAENEIKNIKVLSNPIVIKELDYVLKCGDDFYSTDIDDVQSLEGALF